MLLYIQPPFTNQTFQQSFILNLVFGNQNLLITLYIRLHNLSPNILKEKIMKILLFKKKLKLVYTEFDLDTLSHNSFLKSTL